MLTLDRLEEIKIVDSDGDELAIDASGYITANINGSVTVTATDLDIRSLNVGTDDDHVYIMDSTGTNALAIDASGYVTANINGDVNVTQGTSPWVVSATQLDIDDLVNTSDSVAIGDETNLVDLEISDSAFAAGYGFSMYGVRQDASGSPVSATGDAHPFVFNDSGQLKVAGDINVTEDSYDTIATQTATVGTSAVELASTPLSGRKNVIIQNLGSSDIYVGEDNAVTTSSGLLVSKKSNLEFKCSASCDIWAISAAAGNDIRIFEMAD